VCVVDQMKVCVAASFLAWLFLLEWNLRMESEQGGGCAFGSRVVVRDSFTVSERKFLVLQWWCIVVDGEVWKVWALLFLTVALIISLSFLFFCRVHVLGFAL